MRFPKSAFTFCAALLLTPAICISAEVGTRPGAEDQSTASVSTLRAKRWIHGAPDCRTSADPSIEVYRYDQSSYILRQSKCLSFEAPFIYVLIGEKKVLVLDTGATESPMDFPLYDTVRSLITEQEMLVVHSHSHGDHHAGDAQFEGKPNVTVVAPNYASMTKFFSLGEWPAGETKLDLGGRTLTVIPTPGHQEEAISIYDSHTSWLLTGDTLYPGYVYVKHWDDYQASIARLVAFNATHNVSAVLGAHIEMTANAGEYYPIGTTYQPHEAPLPLTPENLLSLSLELEQAGGKAHEIQMAELIIVPMNALQKTISNIARWIVQ